MNNNFVVNFSVEEFIKYFKAIDLGISLNEFKFQLESHPDYNTLLAFSDALNHFRVGHHVFRLDDINRTDLPKSFMATVKIKRDNRYYLIFTYVSEINNEYKFSYEDNDFTVKKTDLSFLEGTILQINDTTNVIKNNNVYFNRLILYGILFFISSLFVSFFNSNIILLIISVLGFVISFETFRKSLGIESAISRACSSHQILDCGSIVEKIEDRFPIFKKIGLSDLSIIFFSIQIFLLLISYGFSITQKEIVINFLFLMSLVSLPLIAFSIVFQKFFAKKWCPLCLIISVLLLFELVYLYISFGKLNYTNFFDKFLYLLIFISGFIFFTWQIISYSFKKNKKLIDDNLSFSRFKYSHERFMLELLNSRKITFTNDEKYISLGNSRGKLEITYVTDLYCGYCKDFHPHFIDLYNNYKDDIHFKIYIVNSGISHLPINVQQLFSGLFNLYKFEGDIEFINSLTYWFRYRDTDLWIKKYSNFSNNFKSNEIWDFYEKQNNWLNNNELFFTPEIIVNGIIYPNTYSKDELQFLILDLLEENDS